MQAAVDIGNTRIKLGLFEEQKLKEVRVYERDEALWEALLATSYESLIFSNTGRREEDALYRKLRSMATVEVSASLPTLPLQISYRTPRTLGADRIAAAVGACYLYPNKDCLVVDAGTCVTYTLVKGRARACGQLLGGAISPGLFLRLKALTSGTTALKSIKLDSQVELLGRSTEHSIQSGLWHGLQAEIQGLIQAYVRAYPDLSVILSGGDAQHLSIQTKVPTFVREELVLVGLQYILQVHLRRTGTVQQESQ